MKLLDQFRESCRMRHLAPKTERVYTHWVEEFCRFQRQQTGQWRHPEKLGEAEVASFLTHLAVNRGIAESTQNQALSALLFLYRYVLRRSLQGIEACRAKRPDRLPTVLSKDEVRRLIKAIPAGSIARTMVELMYGTGLRVSECCTLRICDLDFDRGQVLVRAAKGKKDRVTVMPQTLVDRLKSQIAFVAARHERDIRRGQGYAPVPTSLEHKRHSASKELRWQFGFGSTVVRPDPTTGRSLRWYSHPSTVDRAVRRAAEIAGLSKRVTSYTL